ncbi:hypothetical protein [Verrucomicrobium spinosum]|uniref:hypothetical protein n=1 Tax=Verrucomicrobium spinosum TaxID=2736 RepID=UPI00094634C3|nr:hypothetical protein [Verrucomicrobium spinosum]
MHLASIQDIMRRPVLPRRLGMALLSWVMAGVALAEPGPSGLPPMLDLAGAGTDPAKIDYNLLPELSGTCALVTQGDAAWQFRLHNYLPFMTAGTGACGATAPGWRIIPPSTCAMPPARMA